MWPKSLRTLSNFSQSFLKVDREYLGWNRFVNSFHEKIS
jgi:hypothetical protein